MSCNECEPEAAPETVRSPAYGGDDNPTLQEMKAAQPLELADDSDPFDWSTFGELSI